MKFLLVCIVLTMTLYVDATSQCVCSTSKQRLVYNCNGGGGGAVGFLYHTSLDSGCILALPDVQTDPDYLAGILVNQVVYIHHDSSVSVRQCSLTRDITKTVTYAQSCPPVMLHGAVLNPTTPAPTTSTTPTTPTTPSTTSTTTTPKPTTPSTTKVFATVPTMKPSTKCNFNKLFALLMSGKNAVDQSGEARTCNGNNNKYDSEALLIHACTPTYDIFNSWQPERKVVDHCSNIPMGEPISVYAVANFPTEISAVFWQCLNGTFTVLYQNCNMDLQIIEVSKTQVSADLWYTISF